MKRSNGHWVVAVVLGAALVINFGVGCAQGLGRPPESDAYFFYQLADSLAHGGGYIVRDGFWPTAPSLQRMPAWPALVGAVLHVAPASLPAPAVMRGLSLVVNALAAAAVAQLTWSLFRRRGPALLAGLLYTVHPMALSCADEGMSEPLFVLLGVLGAGLVYGALAGVTAMAPITRARAAATLVGAVLLGLACLVRSNFILWILFFAPAAAWWALRAGLWRRAGWWLTMAAAALLFATPSTLWAVRNYRVCGAFPVLSTLRGQTFYGGNNAVVAEGLQYWGYWVFPNNIPGEAPLAELARKRSEYQVDVYYHDKGMAYLREHPARVPGLLFGKLVRAYVPVPWRWTPATALMAGYRWILYLLIAFGVRRAWAGLPAPFAGMWSAMALTNLALVLIFYGYSRFAFALEPFFMPFAGVAAAGLLAAAWGRRRAAQECCDGCDSHH